MCGKGVCVGSACKKCGRWGSAAGVHVQSHGVEAQSKVGRIKDGAFG